MFIALNSRHLQLVERGGSFQQIGFSRKKYGFIRTKSTRPTKKPLQESQLCGHCVHRESLFVAARLKEKPRVEIASSLSLLAMSIKKKVKRK
ncbi:MAG: hypothetical protein Kow0037_24120 [Calditrichia bacterium]